MKSFKKFVITIGTVFFLLVFSSVAFADTPADVIVSLEINNPFMEINGLKTEIDSGRGTKPVILNSRTLVPIRAIIEAFGGNVFWDEKNKTVSLIMDSDQIELIIDNKTAYLNNKAHSLDVAPTVINDRTMLPIRFIAESFNLGVAWHDETKTVWIIRNSFEEYEYERLMKELPDYNGSPYIEINNNKPYFKDYELIEGSFEYYSNLDYLGRCNVVMASINKELIPTEKRGNISSVKPTGWINKPYDFVDGRYIYNRCHLIGFQLTGENANKRNLITGTRYLNVDGMLPFENKIDAYIEKTGNNVVYRVTPVFTNGNLLADGVLLEAYSIEDKGKGISFCVFCYNVQPNIVIDYKTGENHEAA